MYDKQEYFSPRTHLLALSLLIVAPGLFFFVLYDVVD